MVAEKEGVSPPKLRPQQLQEPLRHARRTKKQVSDGFTIKAMMKNTVVCCDALKIIEGFLILWVCHLKCPREEGLACHLQWVGKGQDDSLRRGGPRNAP